MGASAFGSRRLSPSTTAPSRKTARSDSRAALTSPRPTAPTIAVVGVREEELIGFGHVDDSDGREEGKRPQLVEDRREGRLGPLEARLGGIGPGEGPELAQSTQAEEGLLSLDQVDGLEPGP